MIVTYLTNEDKVELEQKIDKIKVSGDGNVTEAEREQWNGYQALIDELDRERAFRSEIPVKTSQLENDSGHITNATQSLKYYYKKSETYTQDEIKQLVGSIPKFSIEVVETLPTDNINSTTVYLLKSGEESDNLYTEYIYVNGAWEMLGKQSVDLTGYALKSEVIKSPTTAEVGQMLVVKEVDENGVPTEWEVSDVTSTDKFRIETSDQVATLEPNKLYVFPEMASLEITLGGTVDDSIVQEYTFRFTSGATATTLTLPSTVVGNITIEANTVYEVSIIDDYLMYQSWVVS